MPNYQSSFTGAEIDEAVGGFLQFNALIPDNFSGNDSEKLQACLDALVSTGGTIVINREYTLTDDIIHKINSNDDKKITFVGIGKTAKITMGTHSIVGDWTSSKPTGNIGFINIEFNGSNICFDCNTLIRITVTHCYFSGFDKVFYNTAINSARMQTLYISQSTFRRCGTVLYNYGGLYDVKFTQNIIEWCTSLYDTDNTDYIWNLVIRDCLMEGMTGTCIRLVRSRNTIIDGNYFESNVGYIVVGDNNSRGVVISNNFIANDDSTKIFVTLSNLTSGIDQLDGIIENNHIKYASFPVVGFLAQPTGKIGWRVAYNNTAAITYGSYFNILFNDMNDRLLYMVGDKTEVKTDFNNYTTQGVYLFGGAASVANKPSSEYGLLEVFKSLYIIQRFTASNGNTYVRFSSNGTTWGSWITK